MLQVNALIRRELDHYLTTTYEPPAGCLVTIEDVDTSKDLHYAKVAVSVLPETEGEKVVRQLQRLAHDMQRTIVKRVTMKFIPKLTFNLDTSEAYAERIDRLLDGEKHVS